MITEYNAETIILSPYSALHINKNIEPHTHLFWEFTYSVCGSIINRINGKDIITNPFSEIILMKPGDVHEIVAETNSGNPPFKHRDIYVSSDKMEKICNFLGGGFYDKLLRRAPLVLDGKICFPEQIESSLNLLGRADACKQLAIEQLHTVVVVQLLGALLKETMQNKPQYPEWIEEIFHKIRTEEYLRLSVSEIADRLHYSRSYVCREFKKYVGKTIKQCLNENRLSYSAALLAGGSMSVLEIAMYLNYSSQSAYINAFKKVYSLPPKKWREKQMRI